MRAFGNYSFKVKDPAFFIREISGSNKDFNSEGTTTFPEIDAGLGLQRFAGRNCIPVMDLAMYYDELSLQAAHKMQEKFASIRVCDLSGFIIENICA